jgi:hypothetical protein
MFLTIFQKSTIINLVIDTLKGLQNAKKGLL